MNTSSIPRVTLTLDKAVEHELKHGRKLDPNMDTRKLRRTISNRLSAQRSRIRKSHYINDLERMVNDLEQLISVLKPRIQSYEETMALLLQQNDSLQKLIDFRINESKLSEIELQQKRAEVCRLRDQLEKPDKTNNDDPTNLDDPEEIQDLISKRFTGQPSYSSFHVFHQNGLQNFELCQRKLISSSTLVQSSPMDSNGKDKQPGFMFKRNAEMSTMGNDQEDSEIDQYFNFEDQN